MAGNAFTWVRKAIEIAQLPRIKLNNIQDLPGAKQKVTSFTFDSMTKIFQFQRVGRGPGSGRGKTCGRGHKGQVFVVIITISFFQYIGSEKQKSH